ncbi:hypothetical protein [Halalkalibacillus sediminis]|uniref:hypothetical protein n=1 Tax=Halalkalibacillus sediminis TaxID=2018042 RepID=UPI0013903509|nr:hypothetical protein [Halalkalibacillus sediminis]
MASIQIENQYIEAVPFEDVAQAREFCTDDHIVVKGDNKFYVVDQSYENLVVKNGYEKY